MAFLSVKNATVSNINSKGFTIVESYVTQTGEKLSKYYKVWSDEAVREGQLVNVSGIFSARINEYDGKTSVEIHINKPRIEAPGAPAVKQDDLPF